MSIASQNGTGPLTGHALRNAHLRERSLARAITAPPLAKMIVKIRAETLGMTRLEFARRSGISRGTLRDLELGLHTPTRRIMKQFVAYCQRSGVVDPKQLEELRRLYAGPGDTLKLLIARLELLAGSPRELAQRVGISPATLWEYRRGNFPLPLALLRQLCRAVGEDSALAEALWLEAERQRLVDRGYPAALAEFWTLAARRGHTEKQLLILGLSTATARRLRYLELPCWQEVEPAARTLCQDDQELQNFKQLWLRDEEKHRGSDGFGPRLHQLRKRQGISRRELADLFGIGGKKPARIIKHIEEDGFYSAQAYPAGLAAVLAGGTPAQAKLMELWRRRRQQFHRRHRPETRIDLRLARELYGFEIRDMEKILGYSSLEYQKIERGVTPLADTARERILQKIQLVGEGRLEALLQLRSSREAERAAWQTPTTVANLISLLVQREGGLIPLARFLKRAGLRGLWPGRLKAMTKCKHVPAWPVLERIAGVCGVAELAEVRRDWNQCYRALLQGKCASPLGIDLRLLMGEVAPTPRAFSQRLNFNYSVLVRDLQRIDRDEPVRWFHVERILKAAEIPVDDDRWREIHALWYTASERRKKPSTFNNHRPPLEASSPTNGFAPRGPRNQ